MVLQLLWMEDECTKGQPTMTRMAITRRVCITSNPTLSPYLSTASIILFNFPDFSSPEYLSQWFQLIY